MDDGLKEYLLLREIKLHKLQIKIFLIGFIINFILACLNYSYWYISAVFDFGAGCCFTEIIFHYMELKNHRDELEVLKMCIDKWGKDESVIR